MLTSGICTLWLFGFRHSHATAANLGSPVYRRPSSQEELEDSSLDEPEMVLFLAIERFCAMHSDFSTNALLLLPKLRTRTRTDS